MNLQDVKNIDFKDKNVLIIGLPASGKSYLATILQSDNHNLIRTDDYINYGFQESMYKCLEDIQKSEKKTIVEGVQGFRLLRKGIELKNYYPDIVIHLHIEESKQEEIYRKERYEKKLKYLKSFSKSCNKILEDYFEERTINKPIWYNVINNY